MVFDILLDILTVIACGAVCIMCSFIHFTTIYPASIVQELSKKYNKSYKEIIREALNTYKHLRAFQDEGQKIWLERENWSVDKKANFYIEQIKSEIKFT